MMLVLTGPVGAGKSTALRRALEDVSGSLEWGGCAGLLSERIGDRAAPVGFDLVALPSGERRTFARPGRAGEPWAVDHSVFETFGAETLRALRGERLVVLDELGWMEAGLPRFAQALQGLVASTMDLVLVIQERALDEWIALLGHPHWLYRMEEGQREEAPRILAKVLPRIGV